MHLRGLHKPARRAHRVVDRAVALHQRHDPRQVAVAVGFLRHDLRQPGPLVVGAVFAQMQEGQRHLSLSQVLAERFSEHLPRRGVIERVVRHLERHADRLAEREQGIALRGIGVRRHRAHPAGRRDQRPGLVLDDFQIFPLGDRRVVLVGQLHQLALGHLPAGFRETFIHVLVAEPHDAADRLAIEVVAGENRHLVAPQPVGGLASAAQIGMIHDVVVQQRGRMDVFDQAGQQDVVPAGVPGRAGAQDQEEGANPLPAAAEDVGAHGVDQRDLGIQVLADLILDGVELAAIVLPDIAHSRDGACVRPFRHGRILGKRRWFVKHPCSMLRSPPCCRFSTSGCTSSPR